MNCSLENTEVLQPATFIRRYKRFFADVRLPDGETLTLHCPNTGSMMNCLVPQSPCYYSISSNPKRKLPGTLELVTSTVGGLVCVNTQQANRLVDRLFALGALDSLFPSVQVFREQAPPESDSRFDFKLLDNAGQVHWLEVKSVTLARERGLAEFPDSVTQRGQKHLRELQHRKLLGEGASLLFVLLLEMVEQFSVAADIDPGYASALQQAKQAGVSVHALHLQPTPQGFVERGFVQIS